MRTLIALAAAVLLLNACAGKAPVPGGSELVNDKCFKSINDMKEQVIKIMPGMPEGEVMVNLCNSKNNIKRLDRNEIRIALLGGDNVLFAGMDAASDEQLIRSLYGYRIAYKNVHRKHGFVNPIRMRTDESGFDYKITVIFRDGVLFEKPIVSGGPVDNKKSSTLFDFLSPGTLIDGL